MTTIPGTIYTLYTREFSLLPHAALLQAFRPVALIGFCGGRSHIGTLKFNRNLVDNYLREGLTHRHSHLWWLMGPGLVPLPSSQPIQCYCCHINLNGPDQYNSHQGRCRAFGKAQFKKLKRLSTTNRAGSNVRPWRTPRLRPGRPASVDSDRESGAYGLLLSDSNEVVVPMAVVVPRACSSHPRSDSE